MLVPGIHERRRDGRGSSLGGVIHFPLAQFRIMRDVVLVDCTKGKRELSRELALLHMMSPEIPAEKREQIAWGEIGYGLLAADALRMSL